MSKKLLFGPLFQAIGISCVVLLGLIGIIATGGNGNGNGKAGILQLESIAFNVTEGLESTVSMTIIRTGGSDGAVSVEYSTRDGQAVLGSDYTQTSGTLSWASGDTASQVVDITLLDDTSPELIESFEFELSNVLGATLGGNRIASVTINDNDSILINGKVRSPGGLIAFSEPGWMDRLLALVFGKPLMAGIDELVSPVAGASVSVFEVDAAGSLVSSTPITSSITDANGDFTLAAPLDAPALKYIVRAQGNTESLDGRIFATTIDVDPLSDAVSRLLVQITDDMTLIDAAELAVIYQVVSEMIPFINTNSLSGAQLSTALVHATLKENRAGNIVSSMAAQGQICGTVRNPATAPLGGVSVIVRDYIDPVTRAMTYSDENGEYCVNVPVGQFIVGVVNTTLLNDDPDLSATEWYATVGMSYNQYDADGIQVSGPAPVLGVDFDLESGARIVGTISAQDTGIGLGGVLVLVRDFDDRYPIANVRTDDNGNYRLNLIPGRYLIGVRNSTVQAYASEVHDGADGANIRSQGTPVTLAVNTMQTINFTLEPGVLIGGTITDGISGLPVTHQRVLINRGGPAVDRLNTNKQGEYKVWLRPGSYDLFSYGQQSLGVDLSAANQVVDFGASVSRVSGVLQNLGGTLFANRVEVRIYDSLGSLLGSEISNADGSFVAYTDRTGDHLLEIKITHTSVLGGIIYAGHSALLSGNLINIASIGAAQDLGNISLPDGVTLRGHVYSESMGSATLTPMSNFRVQLRDDNDLTTAGTGVTLADRFQQVRSRGDGSYQISIPAGVYDRIKMRDANLNGNCNAVNLSGVSAVLNYYNGDNSCELNP